MKFLQAIGNIALKVRAVKAETKIPIAVRPIARLAKLVANRGHLQSKRTSEQATLRALPVPQARVVRQVRLERS